MISFLTSVFCNEIILRKVAVKSRKNGQNYTNVSFSVAKSAVAIVPATGLARLLLVRRAQSVNASKTRRRVTVDYVHVWLEVLTILSNTDMVNVNIRQNICAFRFSGPTVTQPDGRYNADRRTVQLNRDAIITRRQLLG